MAFQVLDVLKKESSGAVVLQDAQHIEEQRALSFIGKPMGAAEGVLL